ncbi:MAG: hypothetical protein PHT25_10885 [Bacteroidales bacterium]|nr:hypothetical protein [Bacteroidales bacterium]
MKRLTVLVVAIALIFALAACGNNEGKDVTDEHKGKISQASEKMQAESEADKTDQKTSEESVAVNEAEHNNESDTTSILQNSNDEYSDWYGVYTDGNIIVTIQESGIAVPYVKIEEEIKTAVDEFVFSENSANGRLYINTGMMFGEGEEAGGNTPEYEYTFTFNRSGNTLDYYREVRIITFDENPDNIVSLSATLQKKIEGSN